MQPWISPPTQWPAVRGAGLALLAAALFGCSAPLVQRLGAGSGSFVTASLLYGGAALAGAATRRSSQREAGLRRGDLARLSAMALFGAGIGPVAFAWGMQHASATAGSLMLTMEAVFTAALGWLFYGEGVGRRVGMSLGLLSAGAMLLVLDRAQAGVAASLGLLAVAGATLAWGVDNALSRPLAQRDPGQVVMIKAALGGAATAVLAGLSGQPLPGAASALGLLAVGACGYGLSLRFYLLAQRAFGVARTGSVFAFAPFIGAVLAVLLGDRHGDGWLAAGGALMFTGIVLHISERHSHEHWHSAQEHEHAHQHGDGHHDHDHAHDAAASGVTPVSVHSHPHRHRPGRHAHAHVPDEHHQHSH